jgi:hypothetical protein
VCLDRRDGSLTISDQLKTEGMHECQLAFHLGPSVSATLLGAQATLHWSLPSGTDTAILKLPSELEWAAVRGQRTPPLGWYSPEFGRMLPTTTLRGSGLVGGDVTLVTRLRFQRNPADDVSAIPGGFLPNMMKES